MKTPSRRLFVGMLLSTSLLPVFAAYSDQRLDGIWVGTEKLSHSNCVMLGNPGNQSMPAKIAVAQGGSLLAVIDGYGPGRYTNIHWSGDTLIFEIANTRRGELRLSPDGKTLIEKGSVRRTFSLKSGSREGASSGRARQLGPISTLCVDELVGTFHREK